MIQERNNSLDTLFDGRLFCLQHKQGYRFSIDAVLLAHFVKLAPGSKVLDLGGGCGVISLILAYRYPDISLTVFELQPDLVDLIHKNIDLNDEKSGGFRERIEVIEGDMRKIKSFISAGDFDWVVCNPPYRRTGTGRLNRESEQAVARHEVTTDLTEVLSAISFAVRTRGRASVIYPAARSVSLIQGMRSHFLEPKRLQIVYSYPGSDARLVLIEAVKGGKEDLTIVPPFYVYSESGGEYSYEMRKYYEP
jgi:tRNA1Val (adenine37-N6)-methyltransferase